MSNSDCVDDFELENLRLAALKSMKAKTSVKPVVNNVNNNELTTNNLNNNKLQNERVFKKHKPFNHPQFNQPPQFHNQQQFNNHQQFNQPLFNNHSQFGNQNNTSFNGHPPPFNNGNFNQPPNHFNHQFNNHPNQQFNPQFNQPAPQFTQPKSNLIVLTAGKSSNEISNDHHQMPNIVYNHMNSQQQLNHPPKNFRNGTNKQMNRRFNNSNKPHFNRNNKQDHKPIKDVPTDTSKNTDNLPSRFSRIDRDSSSDEDDEKSDSDDNDIERYRQTYDTNDLKNDEDTQSSCKTNEFSEQNKQDEIDSNIETDNLEKNEMFNQDEQIISSLDQTDSNNKASILNLNNSISSISTSNLNSSISSISTFSDSNDTMVLRNKKRLSCSDQDNTESSSKRLNKDDCSRSMIKDKSSIIKENQLIKDTKQQSDQTIKKANIGDKSSTNEFKVKSEIVFYKDNLEEINSFCNNESEKFDSEYFYRNTRRTTRNNSNNHYMKNIKEQNSNRLNSQVNVVKSISTRSQQSGFDDLSNFNTGNTKKLRSLIIRK